MVVPAAEVVVGDDDGGLLPVGRALDLLDEVCDVLLALRYRGESGVFVVLADLAQKGDRRQSLVV